MALLPSRHTIVKGLKELDRYLVAEGNRAKTRWASSPILWIESKLPLTLHQQQQQHQQPSLSKQPSGNATPSSLVSSFAHLDKMEQLVHVKIAMKHHWRTIPYTTATSTSSYAPYFTRTDVERAVEMAARVGASRVCAVGSGAAMDLAKAVAASHTTSNTSSNNNNNNMNALHLKTTNNTNPIEEILLFPATYGALWASASSHALVLDPHEECWLPFSSQSSSSSVPRTIVPLHDNHSSWPLREDVLLACATMLLHTFQTNGGNSTTREAASALLQTLTMGMVSSTTSSPDIVDTILQVSEHYCSFGLDNNSETRSVPLAAAASLVPQHFTDTNVLTFWASLAPGLLQSTQDDASRHISDEAQAWIHDHAPRLLTTLPLPQLVHDVMTHQTLWHGSGSDDDPFSVSILDSRDVEALLQPLTLT
jgi:hypothetical protein